MSKRGRWSQRHDRCLVCGTTERRHASKGLCSRCYRAARYGPPSATTVRRAAYATVVGRILALYSQGQTAPDIAAALGFSLPKVKSVIRRNGGPRGGRLDRKAAFLRNEIDAQRALGRTWADVAVSVGEKTNRLYSACRRLGVGSQTPDVRAAVKARAHSKYPRETYAQARELWLGGLCDYQIAQRLRLPRTTVQYWILTKFRTLEALA